MKFEKNLCGKHLASWVGMNFEGLNHP